MKKYIKPEFGYNLMIKNNIFKDLIYYATRPSTCAKKILIHMCKTLKLEELTFKIINIVSLKQYEYFGIRKLLKKPIITNVGPKSIIVKYKTLIIKKNNLDLVI